MSFFRRNIHFLLVIAVLVMSGLLWLHQEQSRGLAHVELREEFLWVAKQGNEEMGAYLYQRLLQSVRDLSDKHLADDYQRLYLFIQEQKSEPGSLPVKYMGALRRILDKRVGARMTPKMKSTSQP